MDGETAATGLQALRVESGSSKISKAYLLILMGNKVSGGQDINIWGLGPFPWVPFVQ